MRKIYFIVCLAFIGISSFAQKLPDVQPSNLLAPSNIKIDGKSAEWNDTYAAENKRTSIFYNLANDEKNLYLIIKSANINKILAGGITFTINTQGKKREKDGFSITYPLVPRLNRGQGGRGRQGQNNQSAGQNRAQITQQQRDSISLVQHKAELTSVKEIKIFGFTAIPDSLVSIYNEYGLKAASSIDANGMFVYELAIPLKLTGLTVEDAKEFVYQIKVNGRPDTGFATARIGNGGNFAVGGRANGGGNFGGNTNNQDLMSPTDFWGKYTLVKNK